MFKEIMILVLMLTLVIGCLVSIPNENTFPKAVITINQKYQSNSTDSDQVYICDYGMTYYSNFEVKNIPLGSDYTYPGGLGIPEILLEPNHTYLVCLDKGNRITRVLRVIK